jgi:hypothetical protein
MRSITALTIGIVLVLSMAAPAPASAAQAPPTDASGSFTIEKRYCGFPIGVQTDGTAKTLVVSDDVTIFTSPRLNATLTNLNDPENQVTLVLTGVFHQTVLDNGNVETVITGHNLILLNRKLGEADYGIVYAIGSFSFIFDARGKRLVQTLSGDGGQLIDVCALLA